MNRVRGRLAPSPSGRMHLGNAFSALLAWLSVRSAHGELVLRLEDLDTQRCKSEYSLQLIDDLKWLGIDWDISGEDYYQSRRSSIYAKHLSALEDLGVIYPCFCSRAQRLASSAPHLGEKIGSSTCPCFGLATQQIKEKSKLIPPSLKLKLPHESIDFTDGVYGAHSIIPAEQNGDIIVRRSDGIFAYQLAVVVDDGLMGVNQVVRGRDLLDSTPIQIYLHRLLGFTPPDFFHVPLLLAPDGKRLAKRERSLDMGALRDRFSPYELLGILAHLAGLIEKPEKISSRELVDIFSWSKIKKEDIHLPPSLC